MKPFWCISICWIRPECAIAVWPVEFTWHSGQKRLELCSPLRLRDQWLALEWTCLVYSSLLCVNTWFTAALLPFPCVSALCSVCFSLGIFFWENSRNAPDTDKTQTGYMLETWRRHNLQGDWAKLLCVSFQWINQICNYRFRFGLVPFNAVLIIFFNVKIPCRVDITADTAASAVVSLAAASLQLLVASSS